MDNKLSIDAIGKVEIPTNLSNESEEEAIFEVIEEASHEDHKLRQGTEEALEIAKQKIRTLQIKNDDLAQLGPHRRTYSWWILGFSIVFVACSVIIVFLSSYQILSAEGDATKYSTLLKLSDDVLMTLLATNTVQVVGLLFVVAKWLFPITDDAGTTTPSDS